MGKVRVAKVILGFTEVLKALLCLAALITVAVLLWMWASAHFFSFAIVVGSLLGVGLIIGFFLSIAWATHVVEKDEEEERLAQYEMRWGEGKKPKRFDGKYQFDEAPRGW